MLTVIAYHAGDADQALRLAQWIHELGGVKDHDCLLIIDRAAPVATEIEEHLRASFKRMLSYRLPDKGPSGWPRGACLAFRRAAREVEARFRVPWLWLEPDAVPIRPTWLDEIEEEYKRARKPFMGALVNVPGTVLHMSGVAVYPANAPVLAPNVVQSDHTAWDVNAAHQIVPQMHETALIQHDWHPKEGFETLADLRRLDERACIYHQCKTNALIELLRQLHAATEEDQEQIEEQIWPPVSEEALDKVEARLDQMRVEGKLPATFEHHPPRPEPVRNYGDPAPILPDGGEEIEREKREHAPNPSYVPADKETVVIYDASPADELQADLTQRLSGHPAPFTKATAGIVERLAGHLALIAKGGNKGRLEVLSALASAGLTPPKKGGRPRKRRKGVAK